MLKFGIQKEIINRVRRESLQAAMVIDEGGIQQEQKPVACKEVNTAEDPMHSKFRKNEFVDAWRGIEWVDVIEFKVRQAHQLPTTAKGSELRKVTESNSYET